MLRKKSFHTRLVARDCLECSASGGAQFGESRILGVFRGELIGLVGLVVG